jgi:hypothetical protein
MRKPKYLKHNPKTVALIGMGPSITSFLTETLTQEFGPSWADEVWAINMASNAVQHDVVIWMDDLEDQEAFKPGLFAVLRKRGKPIITTKRYPEINKNSYDLPIDAIAGLSLPIFGKMYFNNGVAMAIAYAMSIGVKTLKMYGCDFTYPNRNYAEAGRGCTEAWMALASASGMTIQLPDKTSLFDAVEPMGLYGYKDQPLINLPDGRLYDPVDGQITEGKAKKAAPVIEEEKPDYVPEDSSPQEKKTDAVHRPVPGTNGAAAPVARAAKAKGKRPSPAPPAAIA